MKLVKSLLLSSSLPGSPWSSNFPHPEASSVEVLMGHSSLFYLTSSFSTLIPFPYFPPVVLVPLLFPLPGCGFPSGSGRLVDQAVGLLGCLPSLWPAWRLHAGNLFTRDCCLPRCKCTMHRAGSVHSVSNPVLWLGLLADNWGKWDESRVILPPTHPPCWKFSEVVGWRFYSVWIGDGSGIEFVLSFFFLSIAPVKASAANVCLKPSAWSLQQRPLFLQWCEKRWLILFPRVLFGLSSFCMENIRSWVSAKVPFRVCRWCAPKKQQTWAGLSHFWLVYADPRCLWARAPTASQKCSSLSPLYF